MPSFRVRSLLVISIAAMVGCGGTQRAHAPSLPADVHPSGSALLAVTTETVVVSNVQDGIERFVPAFPANDSGGVCRYLPEEARTPDEWVASLDFPSDAQPTRRVTVRYDTFGTLTYYADLRGDLTLSRVVRRPDGTMGIINPTGRRTRIDIAVAGGFGMAQNIGGGVADESFRDAVPAMLQAASLGHPALMAAQVRERCR